MKENVTPTTLDFGSVTLTQSTDRQITVRNMDSAVLSVSSIVSSSPRFFVVSPVVPFTVAAGGQQTVIVRFASTAAGAQTGTLSINSNDPDEPTRTIQVRGIGFAPEIDVTPTTLDFGLVRLGNSRGLALTITNTGNASLTVAPIMRSGSNRFRGGRRPGLLRCSRAANKP